MFIEIPSLPDAPACPRWSPHQRAPMSPDQARAELLALAGEMPMNALGVPFLRAVEMALKCLNVCHPRNTETGPGTDVLVPQHISRKAKRIPAAMFASIKSFAQERCELDASASIHGKDLFVLWDAVWTSHGNKSTNPVMFYSAVQILYPGVRKLCLGSGNSLEGIKLKSEKPKAPECESTGTLYWKRPGWRKEMTHEIGRRYADTEGKLDIFKFAFANLVRESGAKLNSRDLFLKYQKDSKDFGLRADDTYFDFTDKFGLAFPELKTSEGFIFGARMKTGKEISRDSGRPDSPNALAPLATGPEAP